MPEDSITIKALLEAGVHFGHQTRRWNPKMARYIYTEKNGVYIINLEHTLPLLKRAYRFLRDVAREGGKVMFVSTKKQAQEIMKTEAERCGAWYVNERWLGGMLTNFQTISRRIKHMQNLEKMEQEGVFEVLGKKEAARLKKQLSRLRKYLGGIRDMNNLPDAIYIIDPRREAIAVAEARKLSIPIVAIVDTNCDPDEVDYVIPGNDDAIRSIKLITSYLADAVEEGNAIRSGRAEMAAKEKAAEAVEAKEAGRVESLRKVEEEGKAAAAAPASAEAAAGGEAGAAGAEGEAAGSEAAGGADAAGA